MSGVLCDRKMNVKVKGKVHRTEVGPRPKNDTGVHCTLCRAETWA